MSMAGTPIYLDRAPRFPWERVLPALAVSGGALYLLASMAPPLAAMLFVVLFLAAAYAKPEVALLVVFASAPFPYDVSPASIPVRFSVAELSLLLCFVALVFKQLQGGRPMRLGPLFAPCMIYVGICIVSGVIYYHGTATVKSLLQMLIYFIVAVVVFSSTVDSKHRLLPALYALLAVGCFQAVLTIMGLTYSIGIHKNAAGASLAGIVVIAFEMWFHARGRYPRLILTGVLLLTGAGLIMSLSRGAWVGATLGCMVIMVLRRDYVAIVKLAILAIPVILICWSYLPESAREYAFNVEATAHNSIGERYENADEFLALFNQNPLIGAGLGQRKLIDATNIVLSVLAETGILGLLAFCGIFVVFTRMIWWSHKRVSKSDPLFSLLAIGAGLMFARLGHGMFDHYWSRGALTVAWCAAGMSTLAYLTIRARGRVRPRSVGS